MCLDSSEESDTVFVRICKNGGLLQCSYIKKLQIDSFLYLLHVLWPRNQISSKAWKWPYILCNNFHQTSSYPEREWGRILMEKLRTEEKRYSKDSMFNLSKNDSYEVYFQFEDSNLSNNFISSDIGLPDKLPGLPDKLPGSFLLHTSWRWFIC